VEKASGFWPNQVNRDAEMSRMRMGKRWSVEIFVDEDEGQTYARHVSLSRAGPDGCRV
jgi:hypothetical protein